MTSAASVASYMRSRRSRSSQATTWACAAVSAASRWGALSFTFLEKNERSRLRGVPVPVKKRSCSAARRASASVSRAIPRNPAAVAFTVSLPRLSAAAR